MKLLLVLFSLVAFSASAHAADSADTYPTRHPAGPLRMAQVRVVPNGNAVCNWTGQLPVFGEGFVSNGGNSFPDHTPGNLEIMGTCRQTFKTGEVYDLTIQGAKWIDPTTGLVDYTITVSSLSPSGVWYEHSGIVNLRMNNSAAAFFYVFASYGNPDDKEGFNFNITITDSAATPLQK